MCRIYIRALVLIGTTMSLCPHASSLSPVFKIHPQVSTCPGGAPGMSMPKASAPLKTLKGTVKAEGDKITFVNDGDQKSWDVINPEALKGQEGHHVQVRGHVYADKNSIHIMSVKMLGKEKGKPSI